MYTRTIKPKRKRLDKSSSEFSSDSSLIRSAFENLNISNSYSNESFYDNFSDSSQERRKLPPLREDHEHSKQHKRSRSRSRSQFRSHRDHSRERERREKRIRQDEMVKKAEHSTAEILRSSGKSLDGDMTMDESFNYYICDEKFTHYAAHLDSGIIDKIKRGEFVELEKLLPKEKDFLELTTG